MRPGALVGLTLVAGLIVTVLVAMAVAFGGLYNVAGDAPHSGPIAWFLKQTRAHSISARGQGITVPADFANPSRIAAGAPDYAEMCSQCHLAPGMAPTEIAQGLDPKAPELSRGSLLSPAEMFWVAKHGIGMTAMPAWGRTHDDAILWNIVAFVRALPKMSPSEYARLTANSSEEHEQMMMMMHDTAKPEHPDDGVSSHLRGSRDDRAHEKDKNPH